MDDEFGLGVAISGDVIVVGAYADDAPAFDSGSAYVYARRATGWVEEAKLTASDAGEGDWFGLRVGASGDTALVGAALHDDVGDDSGAAYVYVRSGTTWPEQQKLTAPDAAAGDQFGRWVRPGRRLGDRVLLPRRPQRADRRGGARTSSSAAGRPGPGRPS